MNTNIKENLKNLNKAVRDGYKRDMKEHEAELHSELKSEIWFLEKTGFSKREIDIAMLMKVDRENLQEFLNYGQ